MKDEKLVVLREWNSVTEAEMAKSILDGAGIFSTIRNEYMSAIYPIGTMPAFIILQLFKEFGKLLKAPEFLMNGSEQPLLLATFERFGEGAELRTENVDS